MQDEIAQLARELQGALDVMKLGGIETLPKPTFASTAAQSKPLSQPVSGPSSSSTEHAPAPAPVHTPVHAPVQTPVQTPVHAPVHAPVQGPAPAPAPSIAAVTPAAPPPQPGKPLAILEELEAVLRSEAPAKDKLERLRVEVIGDCRRCKLHRGRSKLVFGVGNPEARLVFVGEGPGADEDRQGIPFVGKAGQLLTKMIEAMGFARDDVYICNVVKCRPPNNRDPEPDEVEACEPFLKAQLQIVKPQVIVCLGRYAAQTLLRSKTPISKLRGSWQKYEGIDLMPTYHPSYLLREEEDPEKKRKREAWSDLQQVMKVFGR